MGALACVALATAPLAAARPDTSGDGARAVAAAGDRLERAQARLATARVALEQADRRHAEAELDLERRLVQAYVAPAPGGLVGLLSGDATDALAQLDLLQATADEDTATLARFRAALADQEASVARLARVRAEAAALARARAATATDPPQADAPRQDGAAQPQADAEGPQDAPSGVPTARDERDELERLVAERRLPGRAPEDATTGTVIDLGRAPAAPPPLVARPYLGTPDAAPRPGAVEALTAAWIGPGYEGATTAAGERYDPRALSTASRTLPFGTLLRLERNGRTVTVRVNDRGPFGRAQDLAVSDAAAVALDLRGIQSVRARVLPQP